MYNFIENYLETDDTFARDLSVTLLIVDFAVEILD